MPVSGAGWHRYAFAAPPRCATVLIAGHGSYPSYGWLGLLPCCKQGSSLLDYTTAKHLLCLASSTATGRKNLKRSLADNKTTLRNVKKYARGSLVKDANGKYRASKTDPLIREMEAPFANGSRAIPIRGSRDASLLGRYWQAVREFRHSGDTSGLAKFRGKSIGSGENKVKFITDPTELRDLLNAGLLDFESVYKPK